MKHIHNLGRFSVDVCESQPTADGHGTRRVKVGERSAVIELLIDGDRLGAYARKAMSNHRGRSVLAGGAITFRVVQFTEKQTGV